MCCVQLVAGVSSKCRPVNSYNTSPQGFYSVLKAFGVVDEVEQRRLYDVISEGSENVFKAIVDYESSLSVEERGGIGAQTDIIGNNFCAFIGGIVYTSCDWTCYACLSVVMLSACP